MLRRVRLIGVLLGLLVISVSAASRTRIIIPAQLYASTEVLTLAHIARIESDDVALFEQVGRISLGYAPTVGHSRTLTREAIMAALTGAGIRLERIELLMPATVTVERAMQVVSAEQIRAAVEEYVRERYSFAPEDVAIRPVSPLTDVPVPQGNLTLRPSLPGATVSSERLFVSLAFEVDGRVAKYQSLELNIEATASVAVAARQIERGEALNDENVRFERRRVGADLRRYVTGEGTLLGKGAAVPIAEGAVILLSHTNSRQLIKRGEGVKIIARVGALQVFAVGEARGGGRLGDRVEVLNRTSGRIVVGEIIGDKLIRVTF